MRMGGRAPRRDGVQQNPGAGGRRGPRAGADAAARKPIRRTSSLTDCQQFAELRARLVAEHPVIRGGILGCEDSELVPVAERVLDIFRSRGGGNDALARGLEALAWVTFDFLRLQSRFARTGRYRNSDNGKLRQELYENAERMEGYYLDGLHLSYAFWPNHVRVFRFLETELLTQLDSTSAVFEIGVGHGLMATAALLRVPGSHYTGLDVSPFALARARELAAKNHIDGDRLQLVLTDATQGVPSALTRPAPGHWNVGLCCEVLEHVHEPDAILGTLHDALEPGACVFVTTVANIDAEDHVHLFHDADEIRSLLEAGGFRIEKDLELPLAGFENADRVPLNYAAIAARR
jgi:SAM-dependent methyltransferase